MAYDTRWWSHTIIANRVGTARLTRRISAANNCFIVRRTRISGTHIIDSCRLGSPVLLAVVVLPFGKGAAKD